MNFETCSDDLNCTGPRVCYHGAPWATGVTPDSFCFCDNYQGWVGEDCLAFGKGASFWISITIVQILLNVIQATMLGRSLKGLYEIKSVTETVVLRSVTILMFIDLIMFAIERFLYLVVIYLPEQNTLIRVENGIANRKVQQLWDMQLLFINAVVNLSVLVYLNLPLIWIESGYALLNDGHKRFYHEVETYEAFMLIVDVLFIVANTAINGDSNQILLVGVNVPLFLIAGVVYWRLPRIIRSFLKKHASETSGNFEGLLLRIRKTAVFVLAGILLLVSCGATSFYLNSSDQGWRDVVPIDSVSTLHFVDALLIFGGQFALFGSTYYLWSSAAALMSTLA